MSDDTVLVGSDGFLCRKAAKLLLYEVLILLGNKFDEAVAEQVLSAPAETAAAGFVGEGELAIRQEATDQLGLLLVDGNILPFAVLRYPLGVSVLRGGLNGSVARHSVAAAPFLLK